VGCFGQWSLVSGDWQKGEHGGATVRPYETLPTGTVDIVLIIWIFKI